MRACVRVLCCGPASGRVPRVSRARVGRFLCCLDKAGFSQQVHRASDSHGVCPRNCSLLFLFQCVPVHTHPLACPGLPECVSSQNLSVHSAACASSCYSGPSAWLPMPFISVAWVSVVLVCTRVCVCVCVCVCVHTPCCWVLVSSLQGLAYSVHVLSACRSQLWVLVAGPFRGPWLGSSLCVPPSLWLW